MHTSESIRGACLQDLEFLPAFLQTNDAGFQSNALPGQQASRDAALQEARRSAESVDTEAQATQLIQQYLRTWRSGHLTVESLSGDSSTLADGRPSPARLPRVESLSASTVLVTLPSFFPAAREPLATLLDQQRPLLDSHANWIVDVRGNDGGADSTYAPLLPWLVPDGWLAISERIWVTDANIHAEESVCAIFAPGDEECLRHTHASARRMRAAGAGWVQQEFDAGWRQERPARLEGMRPQRVAVLMDGQCGSSCEQFLLTVRQSFAVKLVGRSRTHGVLDASNLRPCLLPSGRRRLWYATTLSNRLPAMPVDGMGVCPDILLPASAESDASDHDVERTRRWLEQGSW